MIQQIQSELERKEQVALANHYIRGFYFSPGNTIVGVYHCNHCKWEFHHGLFQPYRELIEALCQHYIDHHYDVSGVDATGT